MNKEALRKELEDCWDAAAKCCYYDCYGTPPNPHPMRPTYITTRLAALGDDRELTRMCMAASEKSLWEAITKKIQERLAALPVADGEGEKVDWKEIIEKLKYHALKLEDSDLKSDTREDYKRISEINFLLNKLATLPSAVMGGVKGAIEYFKRLAKNEYGASYNVNTIIHVLEEYENK